MSDEAKQPAEAQAAPQKLVCVKKCFHRNRTWEVGETLPPVADEPANKHFAPRTKVEQEVVEEEPLTFKEIQQAEAKKTLESVGHGVSATAPSSIATGEDADGESEEIFD